jgi:hypothetical protein
MKRGPTLPPLRATALEETSQVRRIHVPVSRITPTDNAGSTPRTAPAVD